MSNGKKVVVIGAGILGATSAWRLSECGYEVTLVEQRGIAGAASGANLGQISILDRTDEWHLKLVLDSLEIYKKIGKNRKIDFVQSGGTANLETEQDISKAQKIDEILRKKGVHCRFYMGNEMKQIQPFLENPKVKGILKCEEEGVINPLITVNTFVDMAKENGATVMEYTKVKAFQRENKRITAVITDRGRLEADYVVCASGAWTQEVAKLLNAKVQLDYRRGTAMVSKSMPSIIKGQVSGHEIFGGDIETHGTQKITMGASQTTEGSILIAQATEESSLESREVSITGICRMAKLFLSYFPSLHDLEIVRIWSGVTPLSPDGKPFFGFLKEASNCLINAGFKGAFSTAPAISEHVVEYLEGDESWNKMLFLPERVI